MGRNLELGHLSEEECERILQVMQRDFDLRQKEKGRLNKIEEEMKEEDSKVAILTKQKNFNDNCCMRCFSKFYFIFNQKVQCLQCQYFVCKSCSKYLTQEKEYICNVCNKQRELGAQSCDWFYSNIRQKFKRFGSAKVVRSLYKRKTDSDSENDSGYDPSQYSNSLPVGKRSRRTIEGFFADLNNQHPVQQDYHQSTNISPVNRDVTTEETEDYVIINDVTESGACLATCDVEASCDVNTSCDVTPKETDKLYASGGPRDSDAELTAFRTSLNHVVDDVHGRLDNNVTTLDVSNEASPNQYDDLLADQRQALCVALSELAGGLSRADSESTAKTQEEVDEAVLQEVRRYLGHDVPMDGTSAKVTSSLIANPSYEGDATSRKPGTAQWNPLAATIIHKVVRARWEADEQLHRREEEKVRRSLTKLSNQCTITQLTDCMSETEDTQNSTFAETDNESQFSEQPEVDAASSSTPRDDVTASGYEVTDEVDGDMSNLNGRHDSELDLDDLVALNSPALGRRTGQAHKARSVIGCYPQRMPVSSVESGEVTITVTSPEEEERERKSEGEKEEAVTSPPEVNANEVQLQLELKELAAAMTSGRGQQRALVSLQMTELVETGSRSSDGEESDVTIGADVDNEDWLEPVSEPTIEASSRATLANAVPAFRFDDDDLDLDPDVDLEAALRLSTGCGIPLPSLDDDIDGALGLDEVDLDDLSRHEDEGGMLPVEAGTTLQSEILFGAGDGVWEIQQPKPLFRKTQISAYDNFGERKVGKDVDGPLLMMVPGEAVPPTIGEETLDNLSDLSENEAGSQTLSDFLSDSEEEEESVPRTADFTTQTDDDLEQLTGAQDYMAIGSGVANAGHQDEAAMNNSKTTRTATASTDTTQLELMTRKRLEEAELVAELEAEKEEDPEDADPRFVVRPQTVTVPLGEPARITCHVTGTKPLDIFWYREGVEVAQLEEDEDTDVHVLDERHTLELFNTTPETAGRYVCIAISDKGHSHKAFRVKVTKNTGEQSAPDFLKQISEAEVLEGSGASFHCKVRGRPQPRVTWYKDGTRLHNDHHHHIQKQGNRDYVLIIDDVTLDDDAEYRVVARNVAGHAQTTVQLLVEARTDDFGCPILRPGSYKPPHLTIDTETCRKYAELEEREREEREMARCHVTYPDTAELLRIAEQAHTARTQNTPNTSPTRPAPKLSSIHSQIDEMDKKLNSLEEDVHTSLISRSESFFSHSPSLILRSDSVLSDDSTNNNSVYSNSNNNSVYNMPVTNSLRQSILREHNEAQSMADSMRQVTSSTLEVLSSADSLMKAAKEIKQLGTAEQGASKAGRASGESLVIERRPIVASPEVEEDQQQEELHLCYADFELLYQNNAISKEQLKSGKLGRNDGQRMLKRLEELKRRELTKESLSQVDPVAEELRTSIDCGLKRVPSKRYKRDYIVNRSPVPHRRKPLDLSPLTLSQINTPVNVVKESITNEMLNEPEESIYLTSGKVFSLEERVQKLQDKVELDDDLDDHVLLNLEDEIMRTSAQVTQSERQVSKIEKQVSNLQQRARGESTSNQSESPVAVPSPACSQSEPADAVAPSSPEVVRCESPDNEELDLPSVKNLCSLFNVDDGSGVRRVRIC